MILLLKDFFCHLVFYPLHPAVQLAYHASVAGCVCIKITIINIIIIIIYSICNYLSFCANSLRKTLPY